MCGHIAYGVAVSKWRKKEAIFNHCDEASYFEKGVRSFPHAIYKTNSREVKHQEINHEATKALEECRNIFS